MRKSRAERVRLAVRKFKLPAAQVEAALDRIDARIAATDRQMITLVLGNNETREQTRRLIRVAEKTLHYAKGKSLPDSIKAFIECAELIDKLRIVVGMSRSIVATKMKPARRDGVERRVAIEEAVCLLAAHSPLRKDAFVKACRELGAMLYGTDVRNVKRTFRSWMEEAKAAKPHRK